MDRDLKKVFSPRIGHRNYVLVVFLLAVFGMTVYESVKQALLPGLTIWQSHLITIIFGASVASIAAFLVSKNSHRTVERLSTSPSVLYEVSVSGQDLKLSWISDNVANILGYSVQECLETPHWWADHLHPDDAAAINTVSDFLKQEHSAREYRFRHKDGAYRWMRDEMRILCDDDGKPSRAIGSCSEITAHKQAQETIRKLSMAVDQNPSVVIITDTDGTMEYVNQRFTDLSGYSAAEAIGRKTSLLKSGVTPRETYKDLWQTIKSGQKWQGEVLDKKKDGSSFWVSASISPIKNEHDEITHFVSMEEDISIRKLSEIAMQEAWEQAELANQTKSDFLANMSHELRTPLNAIIGFSDALRTEIFGAIANENQAQYLEHIHGAGLHLLELVNDILDVSAIEAGKLQLYESEVDVKGVVDASIQIVRNRADFGGVEILGQLDDSVSKIRADELRMKQILINLLTNAIKFTPITGQVTIAAQKETDGSATITVTDTGVGMDADQLAKAMEKFGQVDRGDHTISGEGTGLGLPLTKGLVQAHGGTLNITSEPDVGTTVEVHLPHERVI